MSILLLFMALSMGQGKQPPSKQPTPKAGTPIGQNVVHTHQVWLLYNNPPPPSPGGKATQPAKKAPK